MSEAHHTSYHNDPVSKKLGLLEISPVPMTQTSSGKGFRTAPQAPKKQNAMIFKSLKSFLHKADGEETPSAHNRILEALSRAGARKPARTREMVSQEKNCPAPQKLYVKVVDGKTGAVIHQYVSTRRLMNISSKATQVLKFKPWVDKYKIYGKYNVSAMCVTLNAITYSKLMPISKTKLVDNLYTYEACLRLGISNNRTELKPLLTTIFTQISTGSIYNEILAFVTYRLGSKDPVFTHMANVLCHQRFTKAVSDVRAFERMVARKPALQKAMVQIDQAHKARREAFKASRLTRSDASGVAEKADDEEEEEEVSGWQTVEYMLRRAALDNKHDPKQKEKLLQLLMNEDKS